MMFDASNLETTMKKIAALALASAALAVAPARAGEVGLLLDKQFGDSQAATNIKAVNPTGFGIRGGISVLDLKVAELGVTATYHPEAKEDMTVAGQNIGKCSNEYFSIGAQVEWKLLVNLNAGVDIRQEKTKMELTGGPNHSTTFTRPWVRAGIGFSMPLPVVSPFIRLEAAYAVKTYDLSSNSSIDDFNKAMAPKYQIGLYGGIRF
jgi:hypothetical protein